jgi:RIO-like serine/threonine protein kinase
LTQTGKKLLQLIDDLHQVGVVHGDFKPKNVVRQERSFWLVR